MRVRDVRSPRGDGAVLLLDNAGESPWNTLLLAFNTGLEPLDIDLPEGDWTILVDAQSSFLWKRPRAIRERVQLPGVSALILGKN